MKKFFTILLMLFTVTSIALAQPTKIDKGEINNSTQVDTISTCQESRDDLYVEILTKFDNYHYPNDSSLLCPIGWKIFKTNYDDGTYWHTWETSLGPDDYTIYGAYSRFFFAHLDTSCYIKVTVSDDYGNTGTDSIYFNIKNGIDSPDDFEMEIVNINGSLNAKFSFMPSAGTCFFGTFVSQDNISHNPDIPYPDYEGWIYYNGTDLQGSYIDDFIIHHYNYNENTVWNVLTYILDTCAQTRYDVFPGMYLSTENVRNNHFLKFKTSLQSEIHDEYAYTIFSVDSSGVRYPLIVDGEQVILPSNAINYELPESHEYPYYQCAVLGVTDSDDYKILSYSNKVDNPWIDITNVNEYGDYEFQVYPNPSKTGCNVTGIGRLIVTNILGQTILEKEINGQDFVKPSQGIYIFKLITNDNKVFIKKVVIE